MSEPLKREQFHSLIGSVRANGAFPDEPLLAVFDHLTAQLAQALTDLDVEKKIHALASRDHAAALYQLAQADKHLENVVTEYELSINDLVRQRELLKGQLAQAIAEGRIHESVKQQLAERDVRIAWLEGALDGLR